MIEIIIYKKNALTVGYKVSGHANYDEYGNDIVCSSVSVLAINTANAIDTFTDDLFELDYDDDGLIELLVKGSVSSKSQVLLDAFELGTNDISENYSSDYIKLRIEEV